MEGRLAWWTNKVKSELARMWENYSPLSLSAERTRTDLSLTLQERSIAPTSYRPGTKINLLQLPPLSLLECSTNDLSIWFLVSNIEDEHLSVHELVRGPKHVLPYIQDIEEPAVTIPLATEFLVEHALYYLLVTDSPDVLPTQECRVFPGGSYSQEELTFSMLVPVRG